VKPVLRGSLAIIGILVVLGIVLAIPRGAGASNVNEKKWLARNDAVFASLRAYPAARFYLSKTWGIPDRVVHSPADDGPPYSGYVTEHRYKLPKPASGVRIGDFYARQLDGWVRKPIGSCEWIFTSPTGAAITVDACHGNGPTIPEYVVDVNYDEARSTAEAQAHG
jgi:hypothetical protein